MTMAHRIDQMLVARKLCEDICIAQADNLVKNFRVERIELQRAWFEEMAAKGTPRKRHKPGTWCPLNLFSRMHNGSLQIYWQLVHRDRVTRSLGYKHLAKNKSGGYDLRQLLGHANSFEKDLVAEYEEEAELQRLRWAQLIQVKDDLQMLKSLNGKEGALVRRIRAARAARENAAEW